MLMMSIASDIKFGVLDILRAIGIGLVNIIYNTIDVLFNVAHKINSLNFIEILRNIQNSPFTKIFNGFFLLAFVILFLFAVWKITFKIFDADQDQEHSMFAIVKEIIKCGALIFLTFLIFSYGIDLGIKLSNAVYNNFTHDNVTIGDTMKTSFLTVNEACYKNSGGYDYHSDINKVDSDNVQKLKDTLNGYVTIPSSVTTISDFEPLLRNGTLTATDVTDSGAFSKTCQIYKSGIWNDGEDYFFNYNWVFGVLIGCVFLFSIGFAVIMLGRRQLEIAFLMVIAPIVFATSIGRKEQRSALYQQLTSLVLQAGALILLIGLTAIMFNAIQNSSDINALPYFTKIVAQSVLYVGCAMMLLTGSTTLNRFIGENVSANSGRDMMLAMRGMFGGIKTAGAMGIGAILSAKGVAKGVGQTGKGLKETAKGLKQMGEAGAINLASKTPFGGGIASGMEDKFGKGLGQMMEGSRLQQDSNNPFVKAYGKMLENTGEKNASKIGQKWDFENKSLRGEYLASGKDLATRGIANIKSGMKQTFSSVGSIGSIRSPRKNLNIGYYSGDNDKI